MLNILLQYNVIVYRLIAVYHIMQICRHYTVSKSMPNNSKNTSGYQTAINNLWKQFYTLTKELQNHRDWFLMKEDRGLTDLWLHPKGLTNLIKTFTIIIKREQTQTLGIKQPCSGNTLSAQVSKLENYSNDVKIQEGKQQSNSINDIQNEAEDHSCTQKRLNKIDSSSQNNSRLKYKRGPYKNYTPQQKQKAVQMLLYQKLSVLQISRRLGIPCKNIKRWSQSGIQRKKGGGRKRFSPQTQREVARYLLNTFAKGSRLKYEQIQQLAKGTSTDQNFKASRGWVTKFIQRHHLRKHFSFY